MLIGHYESIWLKFKLYAENYLFKKSLSAANMADQNFTWLDNSSVKEQIWMKFKQYE